MLENKEWASLILAPISSASECRSMHCIDSAERFLVEYACIHICIPMNYRLFEPDDFDDLYAIEEICFSHPERFSRRYMRELIASRDAATWVAVDKDGMAGFAIVQWSKQIAGIVAYIETIEVLPQNRSQGIGSELLLRLEGSANAERAIAIWLHVDVENKPAIRLYERLGYRSSGREEHYYARNRSAAIYAKSLA
jgi:ribosomal-protein-alanine N-acetyltransferase